MPRNPTARPANRQVGFMKRASGTALVQAQLYQRVAKQLSTKLHAEPLDEMWRYTERHALVQATLVDCIVVAAGEGEQTRSVVGGSARA